MSEVMAPTAPAEAGAHVRGVRLQPDLTADVITDERAFLALEGEWNDAVARAQVPHPFLRHEWVRTWWRAFGQDAALRIVVVRRDDEIVAIAPLMLEQTRMYGMPVRRLRLLQNDHTPRTDLLITGRGDDVYRAVWDALRSFDGDWDVLVLSPLLADSPTRRAVTALAEADGGATGVWAGSESPYLELDATPEACLARLPAKFRSNLRNRLSRLTKIGEPGLEVLTDAASIRAAAADAWRLEASGWKVENGTAITSDPDVERFYTGLIEPGAAAGWLRLLFLTAGGRRLAMAYSGVSGNRLFLFKTGYDPEFAPCAPFKLLTWLAIERACAEGLTEIDFLGDAEPWKLEWTEAVRRHDWVFVFGSSKRAQLLHRLKFEWGPEVKRWLR